MFPIEALPPFQSLDDFLKIAHTLFGSRDCRLSSLRHRPRPVVDAAVGPQKGDSRSAPRQPVARAAGRAKNASKLRRAGGNEWDCSLFDSRITFSARTKAHVRRLRI